GASWAPTGPTSTSSRTSASRTSAGHRRSTTAWSRSHRPRDPPGCSQGELRSAQRGGFTMGRWLLMAGAGLAGMLALAVATVCATAGCSTVGYYAHSVGGHLELLRAARPVAQWLADDSSSSALKERL